ncbi:site-specific integrase [Halopiger xanaduensis]|uniref:Integrase family protein n=1 Tax=Halopiger xanaduensis (strain DSM 18323 / JCM 14033 / SH-6) TaxID=797210 RepID=F8DDS0_HALXS|nr:site-specific integrase [Halopiger xanaduensis]AEH39173.1 integrase family protein [Halopiger xanaduensis SH-6]
MARTENAKEDAPKPREYRALKRAAQEKVTSARQDDVEFQLECEFVLRTMGELGLRAGEISHMRESWIDFDRCEIHVPEHDQCNMGDDGGPCGYCKAQAKDSAEKRDITYETALRERWKPKNEHAARTIWFGWDEDLVELIDEFMYKNGEYLHSRVSVNRRIKTIASECEMVDKDEVYPHALRAHAAMYHAKKGMRAYHLSELMGWSNIDAAMDYIKMTADDVKTEMKRVHNGARY